jgi:hypothetical protein
LSAEPRPVLATTIPRPAVAASIIFRKVSGQIGPFPRIPHAPLVRGTRLRAIARSNAQLTTACVGFAQGCTNRATRAAGRIARSTAPVHIRISTGADVSDSDDWVAPPDAAALVPSEVAAIPPVEPVLPPPSSSLDELQAKPTRQARQHRCEVNCDIFSANLGDCSIAHLRQAYF